MTARLGYSPAEQQHPLTSRTKFVDEGPKRQGFSGLDVSRLGHIGSGFVRKLFVKDLEAGTAGRWTSAGGEAWQPLPLAAREAAERARLDAEKEASARLAAMEAAELDEEHLDPSRLAEHLPEELAAHLRQMRLPRRREREAAILKKVGWGDVGLIGLDPAMLAARAETEAAQYAKRFPGRDEAGNFINQEPDHRRGRDAKIWRKRLRRRQDEALLYVSAAVGAVGGRDIPGRPLYVGDYELDMHLKHKARTREILADLWQVIQDDPNVQICMLDVDAASRERKAAERRMLIDMMLYRWRMLGWAVCWITITLPGEYVPHSTNEGRRAAEWNPDFGPLEAMAKIQDDFHGTMALLRERGIRPQGWWNAQPQQSGTPHRHILVAIPTVEQARAVCDAFREKFSTRKNDEDGPDRGCDASVIGDDHPKYRTRDGKNGSPETARSAAMYSARYATRFEKLGGDDGDGDGEDDEGEQSRFEAWKRPRRARTHTWLGLDSQRSPVDLWRTHWVNALRNEYEPDDARMALALRHMRSAQAFIKIAVESHKAKDVQTMQRAQEDAAREAWHAAIAVGMWPDTDLDPTELAWLHGETGKRFESMDVVDPLPPVPLREERTSVYGESYSAFAGAVGIAERFRLSSKASRAELYEAAEAVGVDVERPRARLRRQHVLDSIEAAGLPVTWREKRLTLAQLQDLAERLGVTVHVPTVAPVAGAAVKALKAAGFGFLKRPDGSLVGYDRSGEILLKTEHKWIIVDGQTAKEMQERHAAETLQKEQEQAKEAKIRAGAMEARLAAVEAKSTMDSKAPSFPSLEGRWRAYLSDSPNYPRLGPDGPAHGDERPPG